MTYASRVFTNRVLAMTDYLSAIDIAKAVNTGQTSACELTTQTLERIACINPQLNAYTHVTAQRALAQATQVDADIAKGLNTKPLAGVPFAVKNLFDISGLPTLAGSKINAENTPAKADAVLIQRLEQAGAILLGNLNMGEYAYDFTGENSHYGNCHNPWQKGLMSGGSSSGSGSATAAGLAPGYLG